MRYILDIYEILLNLHEGSNLDISVPCLGNNIGIIAPI